MRKNHFSVSTVGLQAAPQSSHEVNDRLAINDGPDNSQYRPVCSILMSESLILPTRAAVSRQTTPR